MAVAGPSQCKVAEIKNSVVAEPICEVGPVSWTAGYRTGQDFHIEVEIPGASPGESYGLNQTLLLASRSAIYGSNDAQDIQLWRTPTQTEFDFKEAWLDIDHPYPPHLNVPSYVYSDQAINTTRLTQQGNTREDAVSVNLRMCKNPRVTIPRHIRRKNNKHEMLAIKQFDVQELYLITLLRDEDVRNGDATPIIQWTWEYKYAWVSCDGNPQFVAHPGFADKCVLKRHMINKYKLRGPIVNAREHHDHFRVLDGNLESISMGEIDQWPSQVTEEWEACDV